MNWLFSTCVATRWVKNWCVNRKSIWDILSLSLHKITDFHQDVFITTCNTLSFCLQDVRFTSSPYTLTKGALIYYRDLSFYETVGLLVSMLCSMFASFACNDQDRIVTQVVSSQGLSFANCLFSTSPIGCGCHSRGRGSESHNPENNVLDRS